MRYFIICDDSGNPIYCDHPEGMMTCLIFNGLDKFLTERDEHFSQKFKSMCCGGVLFVAQKYKNLSFLVVSDQGESEMYLRTLLRQIFEHMVMVFGPHVMLEGKYTSFTRHKKAIQHIIDTACVLGDRHQAMLVRATERLEVNDRTRGECFNALKNTVQNEKLITHALVFVGTKLLVSYTRAGKSQDIDPSDLLLLITDFHATFHPPNREVEEMELPIADYRDHANITIRGAQPSPQDLDGPLPSPGELLLLPQQQQQQEEEQQQEEQELDTAEAARRADSGGLLPLSVPPTGGGGGGGNSGRMREDDLQGEEEEEKEEEEEEKKEEEALHPPANNPDKDTAGGGGGGGGRAEEGGEGGLNGQGSEDDAPPLLRSSSSSSTSPSLGPEGRHLLLLPDYHPAASACGAEEEEEEEEEEGDGEANRSSGAVVVVMNDHVAHDEAGGKAEGIPQVPSREEASMETGPEEGQGARNAEAVGEPSEQEEEQKEEEEEEAEEEEEEEFLLRNDEEYDPTRLTKYKALYLRTPRYAPFWVYFAELGRKTTLVILTSNHPQTGAKGSVEERQELDRVRDTMRALLQSYSTYLITKEHTHLPILSFLHQFPGLVHFLFVDRTFNRVIAPSISALHTMNRPPGEDVERHMKRVIKRLVWDMCFESQQHLSEGAQSVLVKNGPWQFSYRLWVEDVDGFELIFPPEVPFATQHVPQTNKFYQKLMQRFFPTRGNLRCYELFTLYLGTLSVETVIHHNRELVNVLLNRSVK